MNLLLQLIVPFLGLIPLFHVSAVPNVTVIPLGSKDCRHWPAWINTRDADVTGAIRFRVAQSDDPGIEGLLTSYPDYNVTSKNTTSLFVDVLKSTRFAKPVYRCINSKVQPAYGNGDEPAPIISVAKDQRNAFLTFGDGYKLEPYAHEINGTRQPGVFLGAQNRTTWAFHYSYPSASACGQTGSYEVKLTGLPLDPDTEPKAAYDPEFFGFMEVYWS